MAFQNGVERIFLVVSLCTIVYLAFCLYRANKREIELLSKNLVQRTEISLLYQRIESQNNAVDEIKRQSEIAVDVYRFEARKAKEKNTILQNKINELQAKVGSTCEDGVRLIDAFVLDSEISN